MLVFCLVHLVGYQHGAERQAAASLGGGFIQGVGYYLASGCTLTLLVRLGEGSKFHVVALGAFMAGVAAYVLVA